MLFFREKKTALVLGGGGARGLSNIGVIKVLEKYFGLGEIPFDVVIGTSIGSLIGAAYCLGVSAAELEEKAFSFNWPNMVDLGFSSTGLIKGTKFEKIIAEIIDDKGFNDVKKPFALTTTDVETGEELIHTSGDMVKLIRASCSWPGIFSAVEINGRLLVDGGVRNSIPTKAARKLGADYIFAVNPGFAVKNQKVNNVLKALIQSVQIMGEELNMYQSKAANLVVKPHLKNIDQFDFDKAEEIVRRGEVAAKGVIKTLVGKLRR
ncbi:MAG: patatin-like phospholipase family protein [Candidatus Omnitrophica bacterium]|nr:patatin-like phospholipase family protein [Candidatus Omnitrophota bacterium]